MKRRNFLLLGVGLPAALVATPAGIASARHYDLAALLQAVQQLPLTLQTPGRWNLSEVLQHCAQSVRYSLDGYPQSFSPWFQHSAGAAAFTLFRAAGQMRHDLNEPVPAAPVLDAELPVAEARAVLVAELQRFMQHSGPLAPHFAYGRLDKPAYAAAHWLHIRNHLDALSAG